MKQQIITHLHQPLELEKLYRSDKENFKKNLPSVLEEHPEHPILLTWQARLNFDTELRRSVNFKEIFLVILLSLLAGFIAKLPSFTAIGEEFFYTRNLSFIVFPCLIIYFSWKQSASLLRRGLTLLMVLLSAFYINVLPDLPKSDTLVLACIHLPLFLWAVTGYTYTGKDYQDSRQRLSFLRYNGDLIVMTTILLIAGALLTGLTIGLFSLIKIDIATFYSQYIVIWGLAAAPIVATYLVQTNPQLVNKVSPVISKIFTPMVLLTLILYLFAIIVSGKDPYTDRDFLLIFNLLLIGVMALIFFSLGEMSGKTPHKIRHLLLFLLAFVTCVVNLIALSAIVFRISQWGFSPNRLAVLGGNVLMLTNLLLICYRLFLSLKQKTDTEKAEHSMAAFLPIYTVWTMVVTFVFPLLFGFS